MRTSLNEIKLIEQYLENKLSLPEKLQVEARVINDFSFRLHVYFQKKLYSVIRRYYKEQLRHQVDDHHQQVFADPRKKEFQNKILKLFN
jgi:hypothetical protein